MKLKSCSDAIQCFGLTKNPDCAGFILQDGKMTNICVSEDERKKRGMWGYRMEHYEIGKIYGEKNYCQIDTDRFMEDCNAIRIRKQGDRMRLQAVIKPNAKQITKLKNIIDNEELIYFHGIKKIQVGEKPWEIEFCEHIKNGPVIVSDIQKWINKCW